MIWVDGDGQNIEHIAQHGLTPREVEEVLADPLTFDLSRSSRRSIAFGYTSTGRFIAVVYERIDEITVYPITAFDVEE